MPGQLETMPQAPVRKYLAGFKHRLSEDRDIPLLKLIRDSTFIARNQIDALLPAAVLQEERRDRNKRLRRLKTLGQIEVHSQRFPYSGYVYSITSNGLQTLEYIGQGISSVTSASEDPNPFDQIQHFLGINLIEISLRKFVKIIDWYGDRALKSLNLLSTRLTVKDYDALAIVGMERDASRQIRFGLEYERTFKSKDRYEEIRRALDVEKRVDLVIYFVDSPANANFLATQVYSEKTPVCVAVLDRFRFELQETYVLTVRGRQVVNVQFTEFLKDVLSK